MPFINETSISGVVTEGWAELLPGIYARSALGLAITAQDAAPGIGTDVLLQSPTIQLSLGEVTGNVGSRQASDFNWSLYEFALQGLPIDVAVVENDETCYFILLQSPASECDFYYTEVYLPAPDALNPIEG